MTQNRSFQNLCCPSAMAQIHATCESVATASSNVATSTSSYIKEKAKAALSLEMLEMANDPKRKARSLDSGWNYGFWTDWFNVFLPKSCPYKNQNVQTIYCWGFGDCQTVICCRVLCGLEPSFQPSVVCISFLFKSLTIILVQYSWLERFGGESKPCKIGQDVGSYWLIRFRRFPFASRPPPLYMYMYCLSINLLFLQIYITFIVSRVQVFIPA